MCKAEENWGLVSFAVAHLRTEPKHTSEMASQATMGTPVKILEKNADWLKVELPDGYIGWMSEYSIATLDKKEFDDWKESERVIVTGFCHNTTTELLDNHCDKPIGDLDRLCILTVDQSTTPTDQYIFVKTPDGRNGRVARNSIVDFKKFVSERANNINPETVIQNAFDVLGRIYLWGGTSFKMMDCSGLIRICFLMNGILLPRDTSSLIQIGKKIEFINCQPGDLLFYGNETGKVNHVAIYIGNNMIIHSSGYVKVNELDPTTGNYGNNIFIGIRRIDNEKIHGIQSLAKHPWYFSHEEIENNSNICSD